MRRQRARHAAREVRRTERGGSAAAGQAAVGGAATSCSHAAVLATWHPCNRPLATHWGRRCRHSPLRGRAREGVGCWTRVGSRRRGRRAARVACHAVPAHLNKCIRPLPLTRHDVQHIHSHAIRHAAAQQLDAVGGQPRGQHRQRVGEGEAGVGGLRGAQGVGRAAGKRASSSGASLHGGQAPRRSPSSPARAGPAPSARPPSAPPAHLQAAQHAVAAVD